MTNFNTIEEALEDLRQGKIIMVTDDPDRENEGDFICAAEFATTENINFIRRFSLQEAETYAPACENPLRQHHPKHMPAQ